MMAFSGIALVIVAILVFTVAALAVVVVVLVRNKQGGPSVGDFNALLAENDRLNDELDRLKNKQS